MIPIVSIVEVKPGLDSDLISGVKVEIERHPGILFAIIAQAIVSRLIRGCGHSHVRISGTVGKLINRNQNHVIGGVGIQAVNP